jgi:hypothetical protein
MDEGRAGRGRRGILKTRNTLHVLVHTKPLNLPPLVLPMSVGYMYNNLVADGTGNVITIPKKYQEHSLYG